MLTIFFYWYRLGFLFWWNYRCVALKVPGYPKKVTCFFASDAVGNNMYYISGWACMVNKLLFIGWFLCCTKTPFWLYCEQSLNASFMFAHMPKSKVINLERTQIINTYWFVCWTGLLFSFVQCFKWLMLIPDFDFQLKFDA